MCPDRWCRGNGQKLTFLANGITNCPLIRRCERDSVGVLLRCWTSKKEKVCLLISEGLVASRLFWPMKYRCVQRWRRRTCDGVWPSHLYEALLCFMAGENRTPWPRHGKVTRLETLLETRHLRLMEPLLPRHMNFPRPNHYEVWTKTELRETPLYGQIEVCFPKEVARSKINHRKPVILNGTMTAHAQSNGIYCYSWFARFSSHLSLPYQCMIKQAPVLSKVWDHCGSHHSSRCTIIVFSSPPLFVSYFCSSPFSLPDKASFISSVLFLSPHLCFSALHQSPLTSGVHFTRASIKTGARAYANTSQHLFCSVGFGCYQSVKWMLSVVVSSVRLRLSGPSLPSNRLRRAVIILLKELPRKQVVIYSSAPRTTFTEIQVMDVI